MLGRTHPKSDFTIISQICVRVIHRMNVRTENTRMPLSDVEIYELQNDLELNDLEEAVEQQEENSSL